ncbi:lipid-A-disaccharide synthase [Granulicella paludicola]|uniref:lipid-A-disaccharide synthase n=1 Tax=Granulicella paludicola TaxID=474951 RepID=UPI00295B8167|nr:lipid-A-disaccharide synthase [Granulicella paludicola]
MPNPRIFLSAGEASGDAYGAAIITALRQQQSAAHFFGLGGIQMEAAGQQRIVRAEDVAHMGITEVIRHAPFIYRQYRKLVAGIKAERPDVAVLIDFPDVNFRLAKNLHRLGVPVVWFVSPQLWAWKRSRLRWVQERVSRMLVIFPFEETFYRNRGVDATFVGHPLAAAAAPPALSRVDYAACYGLDPERTWIALLPGSRWKEIRSNLPALHELAISDLFSASAAYTTFDGGNTTAPRDPTAYTRYEFLLPVASTIQPQALRDYISTLDAEHLRYFGATEHDPNLPRPRLTLVPDAREALHHARASVVASGTATVLAAIVGNPFVVVYRVSALTFALAKKLVEYPPELPAPHDSDGNAPVGMVNLIAGKRIVPELLQSRFTAANVANALGPLLTDSPERAAQMDALEQVRTKLRSDGSPIAHVVETVLSLMRPA